jgi:replicative DNA helicase
VLRGLLQREERLILTGGEGLGKSTFTRQLGVAAASGRQAFDDRPTSDAGVKVMVVDAENPPSLARGWWDSLIRAVGKSGYPVPEDGLRIFFEPGGLDLGSRAGSGWLLRQVEKHAPDLIIIGPSYKLHVGNPNDERDARRVSDVLDKARLLNGSALIMESHSPHEDARGQRGVRPLGSTLWRRWPEFGLGLQPCDRKAEPGASMFRLCDLVAWRGPRADRAWPKKLRAGDPNHSPWPWVDDEEKRWWSR